MSLVALEDRFFVHSDSQYAEEENYSTTSPTQVTVKPRKVTKTGGNITIDPLSKVLAGPPLGQEALAPESGLSDITRAKFALDVVVHYAQLDRDSKDIVSNGDVCSRSCICVQSSISAEGQCDLIIRMAWGNRKSETC